MYPTPRTYTQTIPLLEINQIEKATKDVGGREYCMTIGTRERQYYLQARSDEHAAQWIAFIENLIALEVSAEAEREARRKPRRKSKRAAADLPGLLSTADQPPLLAASVSVAASFSDTAAASASTCIGTGSSSAEAGGFYAAVPQPAAAEAGRRNPLVLPQTA